MPPHVQRIPTSSSLGSTQPKRVGTGLSSLRSSVADNHAIVTRLVAATSPPIPSEVNHWLIYAYAITLCMGATAYGYDTGFFGGTIALPSFKRDFFASGVSVDNASANLVSLFQAGSFFGAAVQLPFTNKFGRKKSVIGSNIIFIASAFLQWFANGNLGMMMGGRFVGGFAIGISSLVVPVFLSEVSPPNIRGRLVGFYDIFLQVGTLGGFWINYVLARAMSSTRLQWQVPVFLQLVPAVLLAIGIIFVPESPRWLISKGRNDEAARNLSKLRNLDGSHEYLVWELDQTKAQIEAERAVGANDSYRKLISDLLRTPGHRYRLFIGFSLIFFKTFSGVQAVNYFSPRIFNMLGFQGTSQSLLATGLYGTVKAVSTFIFGIFIVDRVGRRKPLMFGSTAGSLCLIFIGAYLTARPTSNERHAGDYAAITAIFAYASIYCFGWNSVPLTLISEIFNLRFRTLSMTLCLCWQWLCTFGIVRMMPVLLTEIKSRTFFIFGCTFFCATPFVFFLVPETKGLPLEAMDTLFGKIDHSDIEKAIASADQATEQRARDLDEKAQDEKEMSRLEVVPELDSQNPSRAPSRLA